MAMPVSKWLKHYPDRDIVAFTVHPEYEDFVKTFGQALTQKQFSCMTDTQRNALYEDLCMPEVEEDL